MGSKVRLMRSYQGVPENSEGIINSPSPHGSVWVRFLDFPQRDFSLVPLQILQDISVPTTSDSPWPFWELIKQKTWYTERTCLGPLFCSGHEHCASDATEVFDSIATSMGQAPMMSEFAYSTDVQSYTRDEQIFMDFIMEEFRDPHTRLYYVSVRNHHVFLIEQSALNFRTYQSWNNSFDLQYWTDPGGNVNTMCEPGPHVFQESSDPIRKRELENIGIQDDKEDIRRAHETFGGLREISFVDIYALFRCLSVGFELDSMRKYHGAGLLNSFPASLLLKDRNTNRWLGKSAISIAKVLDLQEEIVLEVMYVDYAHPPILP